jgi:protein ImuA
MAAAVRPALSSLDRLRQTLCAAEAATGLAVEDYFPLALGIPLIDAILGGGLGNGALHEIAAARETELPAATGFALALAARAHPQGAIWIAEDLSLAENGAPYGPGLATRRLSLAAAAGGTLGLILRTSPDETPSAAATRWIIESASSAKSSVGLPRFAAHLVRNRRGHPGAWIVEWNSVERRFELATHPEPVAATAFDRPLRWRAKRTAVA